MKHHNIQKDTIIEFQIPPEHYHLSKEAISSIISIVSDHYIKEQNKLRWPNLNIFKEVDWRGGTTKAGTFVNRMKKQVKEGWNLTLPREITQEIGNIVGQNAVNTETQFFEIVNHFDWKAGDYGDRGSCFWQNRSGIREAMQKEGNFYALRLYRRLPTGTALYNLNGIGRFLTDQKILQPQKRTEQFDYYGIARSWIYETIVRVKKNKKIISTPVIIIFNSYGITIQDQSLLLAAYLNKSRSPVYLTNKNKEHGGLYMNGSGYVIGDPLLVPSIKKFDFGLENDFDFENDQNNIIQEGANPFMQNAFHYISPRKKVTKEDRHWKKQMAKRAIKEHISNKDWERGTLHQRLAEKLSHNINSSRISSFHSFYVSAHNIERNGRTLSLPRKQIAKINDYNPLKIINHHIVNHTIEGIT